MTYVDTEVQVYTVGSFGECALVYKPKNYRADNTKRACIFLTGAGGDALTTLGSGFRRLPQYLASRGIPVVSIDCGNRTTLTGTPTLAAYAWGNTIAATRIEFARTTILPSMGFKNDKVALLGGSGGFCNALQYSKNNPNLTCGVAGHVGLVDLNGIRDSNFGGFQAAIDTQYGGNPAFEAAVPNHSPLAYAATLQAQSYPIKGWWSANDTFILPSSVNSFVAAAPRVEKVDIGNQNHAVPAAYDAPTADFLIGVLNA